MYSRALQLSLAIVCALVASFAASTVYAQVHIIEKGDTLWSIARQYYGDPKLYTLLLEFNPEITMTHRLRPGDAVFLGPNDGKKDLPFDPNSVPKLEPTPVKQRPRPFEWSKEYHPDAYQYIVSVKDASGEVFFTHKVPPVDPEYRDRRVNKKPGERKTLIELHDQEHPYSDCDGTLNSIFHDDELYRLIRQEHPAIMSQISTLGDVTFKDVNYDGKEDMIVDKGTYGALDMKFVDILLWDETKQTFIKSAHPYLTSAANVVFDETKRTITFAKQSCQTSWNYYKYQVDENNHFKFIETVQESCGRKVTIGQLYEISEAELRAIPFECEFQISNTKEGKETPYDLDDSDNPVYPLSALSPEWQAYINGVDHPKIFKEKVIDYPTLFKRNHTLHFDSIEEMQKWERDNNVVHGLPF
ncbi:MAG: LysM peptidoglycan-binding domain-containing protein [Proteobacteria bacterium]|nr:LysM peptidoglycan-binding domain-containing protein [Pseudomonadota bacterium]